MDVQEVEWIEFFAGLGNLTVMMKACQYPSLRFDVIDQRQSPNRGSNFMDLSHASGFAFLGIKLPQVYKPLTFSGVICNTYISGWF